MARYFKTKINYESTPEYAAWRRLKQRCKDNPNYADVVMCNEWEDFQNFAAWYHDNHIDGFQLDKDLLSPPGQKIYSPETCCFLPSELNNLFRKMPDRDTAIPTGVELRYKWRKSRRGRKFAGFWAGGKNFGRDMYAAAAFYEERRCQNIKNLAEKYREFFPDRVYEALIFQANTPRP